MTELICIVCPKGCHLLVDELNDYAVTGNSCPRGAEYGKTECTNPVRTVTSVVRIKNASHRCCPVKTTGAIPKKMMFEALKLLDGIELESPVKAGTVVIQNIRNTGISWITTRTM